MSNPYHLDYEVIISKHAHREAEAWCRERWGKRWSVIDNRQGTWACFWNWDRKNENSIGQYRYNFKNQEDATLFSLKWQ